MYIYENHMGGLYTSNTELDYEDLYCEQCGDSGWLLGEADTREELLELLRDDNEEDGDIYGGWDPEYIEEFCREEFGEVEDDEDSEVC